MTLKYKTSKHGKLKHYKLYTQEQVNEKFIKEFRELDLTKQDRYEHVLHYIQKLANRYSIITMGNDYYYYFNNVGTKNGRYFVEAVPKNIIDKENK